MPSAAWMPVRRPVPASGGGSSGCSNGSTPGWPTSTGSAGTSSRCWNCHTPAIAPSVRARRSGPPGLLSFREEDHRRPAPVAERQGDVALLGCDASEPEQGDSRVTLAGRTEGQLPRLSRLGPVSLLLVADRQETGGSGGVLRVPRGDRQPPGGIG